VVRISAATGEGIDDLLRAMARALDEAESDQAREQSA
jgi:translation initiation factor IF-2